MKKFNRREFIRTHPLFSSLNEMEIEELACSLGVSSRVREPLATIEESKLAL